MLSALPLPLQDGSGRARRRRKGPVGHVGESRSQPAVPPHGALKTALPLLHPASSCASETCADGRICSAACIAAIFAGGSIMNERRRRPGTRRSAEAEPRAGRVRASRRTIGRCEAA